jgi:hypothetical protein
VWWRWAWRVAADGAATTDVAGMHAHASSFARACARPCSSVPCTPSFVHAATTGGGRHARARAVVLPVPVPTLFVRGCAHCHSSTRVWWQACTRTRSLPVPVPALVRPCLRTLLSLSVRARLRSFADPRWSLAVCVRSVVPWLCLCGFRSCSRAGWCSLGFVCAGSAFVRAHLGLFMLDGVGSERKRADGKKRAADRAIFGSVTV